MKLVLCVHGYPPELVGGTEVSAQALAQGLARAGHQVLVVAGSWQAAKAGQVAIRPEVHQIPGAGSLRVERWTRPDLHFDHWHKTKSARVGARFRELLQREKPDLVHVLHWLRLTRDLVQIAAEERIPAVISLGDSWVSCPLTFRVKPDSQVPCEEALSAMTCISCAAKVLPRTPWVSMEAGFMEFANRGMALTKELQLAQACLVPSQSFADRQQQGLGPAVQMRAKLQAPCGVEDSFAAQRKPLPVAPLPLRLGSWGQLSQLKGSDLLFEAIAGLESPGSVRLELAGGEQTEGYVQSLQAQYPSVQATYHGPYEVAELPTHAVTAVHAMLSASRAPESFGIVLEEARALGLPSVLPNLGAFRERAGESLGSLMFDVGDALSLRKAIERLLAEKQLLSTLRDSLPPAIRQLDVLEQHCAHYERVLAEGQVPEVPAHEWYTDRMALFAEEEWDRSLACATQAELELDTPTDG